MIWWKLATFGVALYCLARGVIDLRQRRYIWGVLGIACGGMILFMPMPSHAVKVTLPITGTG